MALQLTMLQVVLREVETEMSCCSQYKSVGGYFRSIQPARMPASVTVASPINFMTSFPSSS
eukprot:4622026-Heterocapsa_arctica.AAC.1